MFISVKAELLYVVFKSYQNTAVLLSTCIIFILAALNVEFVLKLWELYCCKWWLNMMEIQQYSFHPALYLYLFLAATECCKDFILFCVLVSPCVFSDYTVRIWRQKSGSQEIMTDGNQDMVDRNSTVLR